jgi:hypothetical protein
MTISLKEGKCTGKILGLVVPLPWFKSCCVYVQGSKAYETRDNLGCNVYEGLRCQKDMLSNRFRSLKLLEREKGHARWLIKVLTPITNTDRLFFPCVKHGTNNHKPRRDGTFTYSEDETTSKETSKILASRVAT